MKLCTVQGCERSVKAVGLCGLHYRRKRDWGDPLAESRNALPGTHAICTVDGCSQPFLAKGLCARHYWRLKHHGSPMPDLPPRKHVRAAPRKVYPPCALDGCARSSADGAKGYCARHYRRWKKTGDPGPADRLTAVPGMGHTHKRSGYRMVQVAGRQVKEHRYVMEQMLGRHLLTDENVHHRNGDRADNRPGNLELWSTVQPTGKRAVDLLDYARAIIGRYGEVEALLRE